MIEAKALEETTQEHDPWETALEGLDLITLDPAACQLGGDGKGRLWGTVNGRRHEDLVAHRTFPLTSPDEWISLVSVADMDSDGRRSDGSRSDRVELGVLPSLDGLDDPSREAVQRALRLRYFLPRVLSIASVWDESPGQNGAVIWELMTDRGPMRLRMANLYEGIEQLDSGRIILSDSDGNRADIPTLADLDPFSLKLLTRYYWF